MPRFRMLPAALCLIFLTLPASGAEPSGPAAPPPAAKKPPERSEPGARVEWLAWGPDAFRRAILRERPILLNMVVSWSRPCSEMEAVWADPAVARLVNDAFVAVKVDADLRPDLRERYAAPGWPAVTVLLPNGVPFYVSSEGSAAPVRLAFSALPAERLRVVLEEARAAFRDPALRSALRKTVEEGQKAQAEPKLEKGTLDAGVPSRVFEALRANFDALNGGWTKSPKYPMTAPIEASLAHYSSTKDPRALEMAERALEAVLGGALRDRVDGGLHRIAMAEDWSKPEYEKLLDRNAAFLDVLLSAHILTTKPEYLDRAGEILRYLDTTLRRPGGGYAVSQGPDPASTDGGAYYRADAAGRARMKPPPVSPLTSYGWSAKAAAAEMRAGVLLQKSEWFSQGRETLSWVMKSGYERSRGIHHATDGREQVFAAFLEDQVLFIEAMIDAYQLSGDKVYLQAARDTAQFSIRNLYDGRRGLFADIIPNPNDPARPMREALHPFEWNCRMARVLARLFYMDPQDPSARNTALSILQTYASQPEKGPASAWYALALHEFRNGPVWAWVIGNSAIPGTQAMLAAAYKVPVLWKLVVTLDPADARDAQAMAQLGFTKNRPPTVHFTSEGRSSSAALFAREVPTAWQSFVASLAKEKDEEASRASSPSERTAPAQDGEGTPH